MQARDGKPPRSARLATTGVELSRAAQVRLAWMDFHRQSQNVARTCRHFGISRQTFYRRRRLGVRRRIRAGLPAARRALVRASSSLPQTRWRPRTHQPHSHRGVLPGRPLLAGNEKTQLRAARLGAHVQHRPPSPGSGLPHPPPVPAATLISTKGMKSVTCPLDKYIYLRSWPPAP